MTLKPITLRFSEATLDSVRRAAEAEGISSAEFIRGAVIYTLGIIHGAALAEHAREEGADTVMPPLAAIDEQPQ